MRKTIILLPFLMLGAAAWAQTTSGSIAGNVVDASHAAIGNGQVSATEQEKKFTLTTKTDDAGRFVFTQIPPGTYTIIVEASGFKKYEQPGITLNANDKLAVGELVMQVGALTERIEVTATAAQLQTESAERSSALIGTHTHVPTADYRIFPGGTAFQSDVGMCGDYHSVIGMDHEEPLRRFLTKVPGERFSPADGPATISGLAVEIDDATGLAIAVAPLQLGGVLSETVPGFWRQ